MDLDLDKPFIVKAKKIKEVVKNINSSIIENLKKSIFYEEDKEYFYFENLHLKISNHIITKDLNYRLLYNFVPKMLILKGKKINNFSLKEDEWLITVFDMRDIYKSENKIYAFILS